MCKGGIISYPFSAPGRSIGFFDVTEEIIVNKRNHMTIRTNYWTHQLGCIGKGGIP